MIIQGPLIFATINEALIKGPYRLYGLAYLMGWNNLFPDGLSCFIDGREGESNYSRAIVPLFTEIRTPVAGGATWYRDNLKGNRSEV